MRYIFLVFFICSSVYAKLEKALVISQNAPVYKGKERGKAVLLLKQGKRIKVYTPAKNSYYQIKAKRGRRLFIAEKDISLDADLENDIEKIPRKSGSQFKYQSKFTYDFSFSTGNNKVLKSGTVDEIVDSTYSEFNLGLNYHYSSFLAWRNALFYRSQSEADNFYGLDTSGRAGFAFGSGAMGLSAFGGAGYRFVSEGDSAPFYEVGFVTRLLGMTFGLSYKEVLNKLVNDDDNIENDQIFGISLAAKGAF